MNQAIPLWGVLIAAAIAAGAYLLWRWAREITRSQQDNTAALRALQAVIEKAPLGALDAVPRLLEAVSRIGNAQLEILQKQQHPFGKPSGPPPPRSPEAADVEYEVQQMMRQGMSEQEARLRVNPANQNSVWDGVGGGW